VKARKGDVMIPHPKTVEEMIEYAGPIESELLPRLVQVTEAAAIAAAYQMGRGDSKFADQVAVAAMKRILNKLNIKGIIKIGKGKKDISPTLYIGEQVGSRKGDLEVDIAVVPLEGTRLAAEGCLGSVASMVMTERGGIFNCPDVYMDKIVVGPDVVRYEMDHPSERIDLDAPVKHNLEIIAKALGRNIEELVVVILDRPRHAQKITELREAGARVRLITDGDLMPGVSTAVRGSGIHAVMGIGGSSEAILTATAIKILGGKILARLVLPASARGKTWEEIDDEIKDYINILEHFGIAKEKLNDVLDTDILVPGKDIIFSATSVTPGYFLREVNLFGGGDARVHTISMGSSGVVRLTDSVYIKDKHNNPLRL
jgi:fructose-1,6-bisphosphatase II